MIDGIINVYKEKGFTSHDVVAKLRGILKQKKIGHTGTLDPDAVGVLPVCLGKGTKRCDMLTDRSKTYEVTMRLGVTTDTEDMTGKILTQQYISCTKQQVEEVIGQFVGTIEQIPPMYSALKVNGKKLYELAREGKVIERKPRTITIDSIQILDINLPLVRMEVSCSKGTYIRSLCRDIGETLGCGGCMEQLTRTKVGQFLIDESLTLEQIQNLVTEGALDTYLVGIEKVLEHYQAVHMLEKDDKLVHNGNPFTIQNIQKREEIKIEEPLRVYDSKGTFIGVFQYKKEKKRFYPEKMFLS